MLEDIGDLWSHKAEYRVVTTNGIVQKNGRLVMGAGVAKQARDKFPDVDAKLGQWVNQYGSRPFFCFEERLLTLPTKHHWRDKSDLSLICRGASLLMEMVDKFDIASVVMPRPGCGCGGLEWSKVEPSLKQILDDRFTVLAPVVETQRRLTKSDFLLLD